jgi:chemotaxis protein CheC
MNHALLAADHQDALREIVNIAMGRAGAVLSEVFDSFVTLSVPQIDSSPANRVMDDVIAESPQQNWLAIRQAFCDQLEGEAVVVFDGHSGSNLGALVGLGNANSGDEAMLDVGNMLVGACVNGIGEILGTRVSFSPPCMWSQEEQNGTDDIVLVIGTTFQIAERSLKNNVLIALPKHALPQLVRALGKFLELL